MWEIILKSTQDRNDFRNNSLVYFSALYCQESLLVFLISWAVFVPPQIELISEWSWQKIVLFCYFWRSRPLYYVFIPVRVLPEILGGGVRPASQNPYPTYGQNLRFSLPYLWPDQKFDTSSMTWHLNQYSVSDLPYNRFPSSDQCWIAVSIICEGRSNFLKTYPVQD